MVQILDRIPACDFLAIYMQKNNETARPIVYYHLVNYNFKIKLIALIKYYHKFKFQRSVSNCFN